MAEDTSNLVERLRTGDSDAERAFFVTYGRLVYRMALGRLRDVEAARDVAQETLLVAITALRSGTIRREDNLGGFVYGTARNVLHVWVRRRQHEDRLNGPAPRVDPPSPPAPDADAEALAQRALDEVGRMSDTDRQILQWSLVDGLASGEIASRLGMTPEAVRKRKSRALDTLRVRLRSRSRPDGRGH